MAYKKVRYEEYIKLIQMYQEFHERDFEFAPILCR